MRLLTNVARTMHYKRNQIVFLEGEVYTGFYVVLSGSVKVYKLSRDGEEMVQNRLGAFRSFAESSLFSGSHFYSACAQTMEDSSLLFFPRGEFEAVLGKNPALAIRISEAFAGRLIEMSRRFDSHGDGVAGILARYLLNEVQLNDSVKSPEPVFTLTISKKELAHHLGIAGETLSRILRKFKEEKVVREVSKKIFITDLKKLHSLAQI